MNKKINPHFRETMQGWLSVLPVLLVILLVRGYPLLVGFQKSFTDWNGIGIGNFIGLNNYINILKSSEFWLLLKNNLIFLTFIPIQLLIGIIVAVLIYEQVPGWKLFRVIYYTPQIISALVIGYLVKVFFSYSGPINQLLGRLGLDFLAIEWLGDTKTAIIIIILCLVWINIGWQALLALGGLSSISPSIYEAAQIDGVGFWDKFWKITVPMLGRTIEYSCIMSVIWTFTGIFPYIFSITSGGPGYDTSTIDYMIYLKSFGTSSRMGYASAMSVFLLIIVSVFTVVQLKMSNKANDWEES